MSRRAVWCLIAVVGLAAIHVRIEAGEPTSAETAESSEKEIRDLEAKFEQAVLKGDVGFFQRVLAKDFTHTTQSGKHRNRAEWLANHKAGESAYDALNVDELSVRVYDATAVATGRIAPTGRTAEGKPIEGQYRFMRVWVKQAGTWHAVAFQSTRVAPPEKGSNP